MKLSIAFVAFTSVNAQSDVEKAIDDQKRYFQLTEMMEHYNSEFDERKYWAYGCNCIQTNDRPMSAMGHGKPTDALDAACQRYKECQKCARQEHGETCIGEFTKYKFNLSGAHPVCKDQVDTCKRAICECDAMFAREHNIHKGEFSFKYHGFWAENNGYDQWVPEDKCERHGGPSVRECCGGNGNPFRLYNTNNQDCCEPDKAIQAIGTC
jgi:hypothetical protein